MLKKIRLHGILAKKFGREFELDVASPKEAAKALAAQIPGFEKFMLTAHEIGLMFAVFVDKENITEQQLDMATDAAVIRFVPRVMGAGGSGGILTAIAGVALIIGGFFTGGLTTNLGMTLIVSGTGMLIGGLAMLAIPKVDTSSPNSDGNNPSKGFGQAVTTVAQGYPVPILCGEREIGGFVASAGQYPEDTM